MSIARNVFLACCVTAFVPIAMALTANPLEPSNSFLPLSIHARTLCSGSVINTGATTGGTQADCSRQSASATNAIGKGEAHANLNTGELRATATSQSVPGSLNLNPGFGRAEAALYDTLTPVGPVTTGFFVTMKMTVDGFFSSNSPDPRGLGSPSTFAGASLLTLAADTGFVRSQAGVGIELIGGNRPGDAVVGRLRGMPLNATTNIDPATQLFDSADMRFTLIAEFLITPQSPSFAFLAQLRVGNFSSFAEDASVTRENVLDFGNTARLSIEAPPGVTFISDSGAFLVAVPEPATQAMLAAGLVFLWATARRRASSAPATGSQP